MDGARLYSPDADAKIIEWRQRCFERLGFTRLDASALSVRRDIDRQAVASMVAAGCPPHVALEIVL